MIIRKSFLIDQEKLGIELMKIMKQRELSFEKLAIEIGINVQTLKRFLHGEKIQIRSLSRMEKYVDKFKDR